MVGFDDGTEKELTLDGRRVATINVNLSSLVDVTRAVRLRCNLNRSFMGDTKGGAFDIQASQAIGLLRHPNPSGRPNSDVVVPWVNGLDLTRRNRDMWIIDFGVDTSEQDAAQYEAPFEYLRVHVKPQRGTNKRESYRRKWWMHVEPRSGMRPKIACLPRFLTTTTVSKHRLFVWFETPVLPDHQLIAFAMSEDSAMGMLHSCVHEVWARAPGMGTQVRERESGFRYTPTTCFETFPFPKPTEAQLAAIGEAAAELDRLRCNWLNPPEWTRTEVLEFPGSAEGPWKRYVDAETIDDRGIGTVRYPRLVPRDEECAKELKKRTLTNLYNQRPTWLDMAHRRLDEAVFAAYGWPADSPAGRTEAVERWRASEMTSPSQRYTWLASPARHRLRRPGRRRVDGFRRRTLRRRPASARRDLLIRAGLLAALRRAADRLAKEWD